ncbi:uncharacterized protein [Dendropsophus ebraccatus]|uniref:uncharacterized protein isoform X2 n=1 Tax=Dendropsophus ebraccatus TaxID=150705 RepID=UPI0038315925
MFSRLFSRWFGADLSAEEKRQAYDAKGRTLRLLLDALKKKKSLLVEDPKEFGERKMTIWPLLTTGLVKELIEELEKVTFAKNPDPVRDKYCVAYVYSRSKNRTIYLCAEFWKMDPESRSQQDTIIHEVSHLLGYGHTVQENSEAVQRSPQSMLCPLTAYSASLAFTMFMDHPEPYRDGSYSCCGETSRDTVCEKSWMANNLRLKEDTMDDLKSLHDMFSHLKVLMMMRMKILLTILSDTEDKHQKQ